MFALPCLVIFFTLLNLLSTSHVKTKTKSELILITVTVCEAIADTGFLCATELFENESIHSGLQVKIILLLMIFLIN